MIVSFNKIAVFNPKSLIRVVYLMTKLLISHITISLLISNSTNYYQLTNYYVDKTKLLFIHQTTTFWYFTFHSSTLQLFVKLLLSYYETTISEADKDYWIIYKQKSTLESWQPVFVPSVFILWWNLFFLNSLEQRDTDSLFPTIPLWYSLFGVGMFRVWNGCVYNLWKETQESYSDWLMLLLLLRKK